MKSSGLIFCSLFILNILDCLTGWYKAKVLKRENSKSGYKGIINKISIWILVLISFIVSFCLKQIKIIIPIDVGVSIYLGWLTLILLIINEARSIVENLIESNVKVPKWLSSSLEVYQNSVESMVKKNKASTKKRIFI